MPGDLNIFLTTFNLNLRGESVAPKDLAAWLAPRLSEFSSEDGRAAPPDLVVIGVQEVAALEMSFAGLNGPLLSLLTMQISTLLAAHATSLRPPSTTAYPKEHYTLLSRTSHVGVVLWIFALDRTLPSSVKSGRGEKGMVVGTAATDSVGLGFLGGVLGNKGAVGARIWVERGQGEKPHVESLTFVAAHFAPHSGPKNLALRIANYARLTSYLSFPLHPPSSRAAIPTQIDATSHLFLLGDLNYRLGSTPDGPEMPSELKLRALIEDGAEGDGGDWSEVARWDTLAVVQRQGRTLGGFEEMDISTFAPTYKRIVGKIDEYSTKRTPSYTDRILYRTSSTLKRPAYTSIPTITLSDHCPVVLSLALPLASTSLAGKISASNQWLPIQLAPPASDWRRAIDGWGGWLLDGIVGWVWFSVRVLGFGKGPAVGGVVLVVLALAVWYLG